MSQQRVRRILKIRDVAGSIVVSLPKELRAPLDLNPLDHVMIEVDKDGGRLILTKE
jgi:bifunctional DNA-binding transcriptional regulator/antitoxin component of YhaV-PrlF toxin-antitoxin module